MSRRLHLAFTALAILVLVVSYAVRLHQQRGAEPAGKVAAPDARP